MSTRESKPLVEAKGRALRQQVAQLKANRKQISQELEIARLKNQTDHLTRTLSALCRHLTDQGVIDESTLQSITNAAEQENSQHTTNKTVRPSLINPDPR